MKNIEVTDEVYATLVEISKLMHVQDNRATASGAPKPDNAATKDDFAHSDGSEGSDDLPF